MVTADHRVSATTTPYPRSYLNKHDFCLHCLSFPILSLKKVFWLKTRLSGFRCSRARTTKKCLKEKAQKRRMIFGGVERESIERERERWSPVCVCASSPHFKTPKVRGKGTLQHTLCVAPSRRWSVGCPLQRLDVYRLSIIYFAIWRKLARSLSLTLSCSL